MLNLNTDKLIKTAVLGQIVPQSSRTTFYTENINYRGRAIDKPMMMGSIAYNVKVGDSAMEWQADHVEPGVSVVAEGAADKRNSPASVSFSMMVCLGNRARVTSGDAKGAEGVVTGFHGGQAHALMDFADQDLDKMVIGDRIQITTIGSGLAFTDSTDIKLFNVDPDLLEKVVHGFGNEQDVLPIPVTAKIPPYLMGSGLGYRMTDGDWDMSLQDKKTAKDLGLDKLKLGDVVAIQDFYCRFAPYYLKGAVTVGVVAHGDSDMAGHGPGVTIIASAKEGKIKPEIDAKANIGQYLGLGRFRK